MIRAYLEQTEQLKLPSSANRATPDPACIHLSLTQQEQLDLPGSLFTVVPQVPVDHLAALLRRFVVCAQSTPHLLLIGLPNE